jgi:hypothetical protein
MTGNRRDAESEGELGIRAGMGWIDQHGIADAALKRQIEAIDIESADFSVIVAAFLALVYPDGQLSGIDIFEADEIDAEGRSMMTSYICGFIAGAQEELKALQAKPLH